MANRNTKKQRLEDALDDFDILAAQDYEVLQLSPYHFRINGRLDIWPSTRKAYDTKSHTKAQFKDLVTFVRSHFEAGRLEQIGANEYRARLSHLQSILQE